MSVVRLVTRSSRLALWQAHAVAAQLEQFGVGVSIIPLKSSGDLDLVSPIYEMGVQGVFTRELDAALLQGGADIAVHSLKDIPVVPALGLTIGAVLPRGNAADVLIYNGVDPTASEPFTVATSSIRRRAQWLAKFPKHTPVNIRGNVETRIQKMNQEGFNGLIMAAAAIERLAIQVDHATSLDWMLPAPGQGAIAIVCREGHKHIRDLLAKINHEPTLMEVHAERSFLHELKGGCSAPISAHAVISGETLHMKGAIHSLDGRESCSVSKTFHGRFENAGVECARELMEDECARAVLHQIFSARPNLREE